MTRNHVLLFVLITTIISCGKESYLFESKINAEKLYHTRMSMESENQTEFGGILEGEKNETIRNNSSTNMSRIITTQRANDDGQIPALLEYGKIISNANGNETESPISGAMVSGIYSDNKFKVREVISDNLDNKTKESIKYALENVKADIEFPEKPLKIGDSFEHKMPMTIPIQEANPVKIDIIKTFTLKSVKNGMAMFDLKENILLSTEIEQANVTATGNGFGEVQFDINQNQIMVNNATFSIDLSVKSEDGISINSKINSKSSIWTTVQ